MKISSIKPYKETVCLECKEMAVPDLTVKITISERCILGPHFHHQKFQQQKYKEKKLSKPRKEVKKSAPKVRQTDMSKRTLPSLLLLAQETFNTYIRKRDSKGDHFVCISCKNPKSLSQMNAGHFYSAGNHSYLRFNENNVHGQCIQCNCHMHGNLLPYRENLINKIGYTELKKLDDWKNFSFKWDKAQIIGIIELYRVKIKADFL